jgi:hypothetical protein
MTKTAPGSRSLTPAIATLALIGILEFIAIYQIRPPDAVPANAPPAEFSSARALQHLKLISERPHPTGSAENARVRAYIIDQLKALGLTPQVQTTTATFTEKRWHGPIPAATVNNILGTLKGRRSARAVMLVAHYDSVATGPGASDNGSGTVTLLETARALKASPSLENDVMLLFTDGEELGLLGAKGFVDAYPRLKEIGAVLNFDSRGSCGPAALFETSERNGWLIQQFARAAPHPFASSFMYEAYKKMPNDTDLTIFKRAGLEGLNFGYIGCWTGYHTREDTVQNTDARSVQHEGSYALALARHFGDLNLEHPAAGNTTYFTLFGITLCYSERWVIPLVILAWVLFGVVMVLGFKKRQLTVSGILLGSFGWLLGAVVAAALSEGCWRALRRTRLASILPYGNAYNGDLHAIAFVALTVAVVTALYLWLQGRIRIANLTVGALAWWAILAALSSFYAPGGSYLFVWPLLFSLVALGYAFASKDPKAEEESLIIWTLPAIAGILLFGAQPFLEIQLMSTIALPIIAITTALLAGFLLPQIHIVTSRTGWFLPALAFVVMLAFMIGATLETGYDARHPRADSVFYVFDADTGKRVWASADTAPDPWTSQFLAGHIAKTNLNELSTGSSPLPVLEAEAPAANLASPQVMALDDVSFGSQRTLSLLISSPRQARVIWVAVQDAEVLEAQVNGKQVPNVHGRAGARTWRLTYVGVPKEGVTVSLTVPASQAPTIRVIDQADGLPEMPGLSFRPRPDTLMPSPRVPFDSSTLVSKTFPHFAMHHGMGH